MVKHDNFLYFIEKRLSRGQSIEIWSGAQTPIPPPDSSYAAWFFLAQKKYFEGIYENIKTSSDASFKNNGSDLLDDVESRTELLIDLCGDNTENDLCKELLRLKRQIQNCREELSSFNGSISSSKSNVRRVTAKLVSVLSDLSEKAFYLNNKN